MSGGAPGLECFDDTRHVSVDGLGAPVGGHGGIVAAPLEQPELAHDAASADVDRSAAGAVVAFTAERPASEEHASVSAGDEHVAERVKCSRVGCLRVVIAGFGYGFVLRGVSV